MSRLPRAQEHLKTAFAAEAVSAAHFRAYARWAEEEGLPVVASTWREMAAAKDDLAVHLLGLADQIEGGLTDVMSALSEERFENDVLYPKMVRDSDPDTADAFLSIIARQKDHLKQLELLRSGTVDLAVMLRPEGDREFTFLPMFDDELRFVVAPHHRWAHAGRVVRVRRKAFLVWRQA